MTASMDMSFIDRTLKTTAILVLLFVALGSLHFPFYDVLAIVSGTIWSLINLYFLALLIRVTIRPEGPDKVAAAAFLFIKVPLLYLAGYFLLTVPIFQLKYLVIGFSVPLAVILLKVLGRVLLGLDQKKPNHESQQEAA
jgi:hypothetical protein